MARQVHLKNVDVGVVFVRAPMMSVSALLLLRFTWSTRHPFPQGRLEFLWARQRLNMAWYFIPHFYYSDAKKVFPQI
jgi:hypothetical protein